MCSSDLYKEVKVLTLVAKFKRKDAEEYFLVLLQDSPFQAPGPFCPSYFLSLQVSFSLPFFSLQRRDLLAALLADIGEFQIVGFDLESGFASQAIREILQKNIPEFSAAPAKQMIVPHVAVVAVRLPFDAQPANLPLRANRRLLLSPRVIFRSISEPGFPQTTDRKSVV